MVVTPISHLKSRIFVNGINFSCKLLRINMLGRPILRTKVGNCRLSSILKFSQNETIFDGKPLRVHRLSRLSLCTKVRRCWKNANWNGFSAEVVIGTRIRPFHFVHESGTVSSHGNDRRAWLLQNGTMR